MNGVVRSRILIVEDEQSIADKFRRILAGIGQIRVAERENEVLRHIIDFKPHLILLDIVLEGEKEHDPWEAGIKILEGIRDLTSPAGELPVIIVTANVDIQVEQRCRELGVVDYLRKPVDNDTLRQAVQQAVKKFRVNRVFLLENLVNCFSDGELNTLCFNIGIDYQDIPGANKNDRARELIMYVERRGDLQKLVSECQRQRPTVDW